jgi:hypothetical protein
LLVFLSKEHSSKIGGVWTRQRRITVQRALQIWSAPSQHSPMTSLQNLKDKSFVKVNDEGELVMDNLLCDGLTNCKKLWIMNVITKVGFWNKGEASMVLFSGKVFLSSSNVH